MSKVSKIVIIVAFAILFGTAYAVTSIDATEAQYNSQSRNSSEELPYPLKSNKLESFEDIGQEHPMDLDNPSNISTQVEYDPVTGLYFFRNKVGDMDIVTPYSMTEDEYMDYSMKQSMREYWKERAASEVATDKDKKFSLTNIQIGLGASDKVFGPGGVQVKMQGSVELLFGFKFNKVQNPTMSERLRNPPPVFDFDEKIQLNVNGKVGDKLNFQMNYNTEASFDFDQSKIKLAYEGKEDEIIRSIEAGNVSMPLNSSLIRGSSALFGIKTDLQFGKLGVSAILSQQESETKTMSLKDGAQFNEFQLSADAYDENRHFFLSHYFRDNYEKAMSRLPNINSNAVINRVEVWVTNKQSNFEQSRNVVAFMDLGETDSIAQNGPGEWSVQTTQKNPFNKSNSLYESVIQIDGIRDIQRVNSVMETAFAGTSITGGEAYEKVESARRLDPSEYTLNTALGYISLRNQLNNDEVLAVAFEYTYGGKVYQVGEFSTDGVDAPNSLIVKLLKGTAFSPSGMNWHLMMKNIYSLGASQIQAENFELSVMYQSDSAGIYVNYLPEGKIKNQNLLKVLKLDRLNRQNKLRPDGYFDFIEGYTIQSQNGRIIFPVLEPFGSSLSKAIDDPVIAEKYVYQELYDYMKTGALEFTEKNKFRLRGRYKGSSNSEIRLNAMNVPRGSVTVTAGGIQLTENVDYTVDYSMGTVTILNQGILESGTPIDVSMESQSLFSMQRKTLMGVHLEYQFNKDFSIGGTLMHLSEKPLTNKVSMGDEPMSNTIWGLNTAYRKESQLITNLLDKLPLLKATTPSSFTFNGEFAHLIPGHPNVIGSQGLSYIDDFESSKSSINILYPYSWYLSSTPRRNDPVKFKEATLSNNLDYGKNRALLSWYTIDPLFTRSTSTTPEHIKNDKNQLSDHRVREVQEQEIFPNREPIAGQSNTLSVLNLSYYPTQRGPYNLDADNINPDGSLRNPQDRWGGMMRRMDVTDFEAANIEYIEFWMMDPFVYNPNAKGGDLYFNLGEISEDILRDGKKAFENGYPVNGDTLQTDRTIWGRVPKTQSMVNAFDNDESSRQYQDVGLNGLRTEDEFEFPSYKNYVEKFKTNVSPTYLDSLQNDAFSPLNDPAGDNFRYFRGSELDRMKASILERYKYYNGMEGNSPVTTSTSESYSSASSNLPNVEDINQDNNLNEYEKFFEYRVSLRPSEMVIGQNFITDKRTVPVSLKNGNTEEISWYQFKVPLKEYNDIVGNMGGDNFKSIRFMRMYLTEFEEETHLRFGTLELVRGDWRIFSKDLYDPANPPSNQGSVDVAVVNIEENANKKPVNYVLPPGVDREQDPGQSQIRQENEQSLSMKINELAQGDARAIYKNTYYDFRQYKRLQMFTHAEKLIDDVTDLKNSELTVFIRLGSDLTENYYEYEIPLQLTPSGVYSQTEGSGDRAIVWPSENMFDFPFKVLTDLKLSRNRERRKAGSTISLTTAYSEYDPSNERNKITIVGNPSLAEVQSVMVGVRNQSRALKSGEVWINELRLSGFNEDGGYAALANATLNLSDVGNVSVAGRIETAGFGGIEDNLADRRQDDYTQFNISTSFELGRLAPDKLKLRVPMYYSYTKEVSKPKYDPYNQDLLLDETLDNTASTQERDSIADISNTIYTTKSLNFTNVKFDIRSKTPRFYDPTNFSLNYSYTESKEQNPEVARNLTKDYRGAFNYMYSVNPKPWEPFKNVKALNKPAFKIIKDINLFYLPNSVAYSNTWSRFYNEVQLRGLNNPEVDYNDPSNPLLSNSKDFLWNRKFDIKYDLSRNLKFSLSTSTNAAIDETKFSPVNKKLFPTEYENWKDTVWHSMMKGGTPLAYQQLFTASYALPLNKIPIFSWITSNVMYSGNYTWDRGVLTEEDDAAGRISSSLGNNITSLGVWQWDGRFNLEQLYNKSSYLKSVNQRFSSRNRQNKNAQNQKPRTNEQKLKLVKGKKQRISHRLSSERVKVVAVDSEGKEYKLKYTALDRNAIEITPKEDIELTVTTTAINPQDAKGMELVLQTASRMLMMFRNVSFNYNQSDGMAISGWEPNTGILGQDNSAPGMLFTLGYQEPNFIQDSYNRGWLISDSTISAVSKTHSSDLMIKMLVEPIPGLKIDLGATRNYAKQSQVQYMYDGMPTTYSGTFSMSTIALRTLFKGSGNADNYYQSEVYDQFLANRSKVQNILEGKYSSINYPTGGFMENSVMAPGSKYDPANGSFGMNTSDVLIPSFIAAYTGSSVSNSKMDLIPGLLRMLPNWRISYDGLSRIPFIQRYFRSVNLTHSYTCKYNVGSFSSYANFIEVDDGWGFVQDVTNGNPVPSSQYDVASVSITESFNPLLRVDATLKNSFTFSTEYRRGRNLALNVASTQIVESSNSEYVIGVGYRISDFDVILKLKNDKESKVKNDLNLRLDLSFRDTKALIRKIDDELATQATSGENTYGIQFSAEYIFSARMNFRLYYDRQVSTPLISSSYPTSNSNFGVSVKVLLTQ